jgi:hypothetical protein
MVFVTGGTSDLEASAFLDSNRSVGKPFDNAELLALVSESMR